MFWAALGVIDNAADIWGSVCPLVVSRNKTIVGSIEKVLETISI